jgi:hypothetical protein
MNNHFNNENITTINNLIKVELDFGNNKYNIPI